MENAAKHLNHETEGLMAAARRAAHAAYAEYSRFFVGAAVRCQTGKTYIGCNVENIAFPLGVCAEACAIAAARAAEGPAMKIVQIAIFASKDDTRHVGCSPCGGCRQRIAEFGSDIEVLFFDEDLRIVSLPVSELLPHTFKFEREVTSR